MMTLMFLTLNAFANDDFLSDLEASIAQEQAEDAAETEAPQSAQVVTPPAAPAFEDELSFDIPTDTNATNIVVESPDGDILNLNLAEPTVLSFLLRYLCKLLSDPFFLFSSTIKFVLEGRMISYLSPTLVIIYLL